MATFTIELREVLELTNIWDEDDPYPIFDEDYRERLNKAITDEYYYREIGYESIDMFVNRLNVRMRRIMPTYNKLYESTRMEYDPLISMKMVTETENESEDVNETLSNVEAQSAGQSGSESTSRSVNSDFPQTMLSDSGDYATSAADSGSQTASTTNGTESATTGSKTEGEGKTRGTSSTEGFAQSPSSLLLQYRETLINVDEMIITELSDLFFGLWNTGDEYGQYDSMLFQIGRY